MNQYYRKTPPLAATALGGLIAGFVTGATVAAATNARAVKKGKITKKEAAANVMREATSMGLATTVGVSATAMLGMTGILSVAGVALFTAGSKYALDSLLDKNSDKGTQNKYEERLLALTSDDNIENTDTKKAKKQSTLA